ncbi:MAG: tetratricopeptide repeat protein, partial [Planctomycetota bacterium]
LLLTNVRLSGDAKSVVLRVAAGFVYPSNALASYLFIGTTTATGGDAALAIRLVSCLSGVVFVLAAVGIARECFADGPRRAALCALLLTAGPAALFFGTVEVYAPLAAGVALYLLAALRRAAGKGPRLLPALLLGVAFCLHGSAGLLLPSLLLLEGEGRILPLMAGRRLVSLLAFLLPVALVFAALYLGTWAGEPPPAGPDLYGTFAGPSGLGPLPPLVRTAENLEYRYAILDIEHLVGVLNLWLLASPAGIALLVAAWRGSGARRVRWLHWAALLLLLFPALWNVSYGLRRDWDLFAVAGLPLALLGGLAFLREGTSRGTALKVAALSLFCFLPLVLGNTGVAEERRVHAKQMAEALERAVEFAPESRRAGIEGAARRWRERERLQTPPGSAEAGRRAGKLWREGDLAGAEGELRRAIRLRPGDAELLAGLGELLLVSDRRGEARDQLDLAVRTDPTYLLPRILLARIDLAEGRREEAARRLRTALRMCGTSAFVEDARALLETLGEGR